MGSSKTYCFETYCFDNGTTENNNPRYVKDLLGSITVSRQEECRFPTASLLIFEGKFRNMTMLPG